VMEVVRQSRVSSGHYTSEGEASRGLMRVSTLPFPFSVRRRRKEEEGEEERVTCSSALTVPSLAIPPFSQLPQTYRCVVTVEEVSFRSSNLCLAKLAKEEAMSNEATGGSDIRRIWMMGTPPEGRKDVQSTAAAATKRVARRKRMLRRRDGSMLCFA
jgi:hypothetical protein